MTRGDFIVWLGSYWNILAGELDFWAQVFDFRYRFAGPPCSATILCDCNRRSCPYRQTSPVTMWRRFKQYDDEVAARRIVAVSLLGKV